MEILGQDRILNRISKLSLDTFPRSLLLVGDKGSGKHMLASYISNKLHISLVDITDHINLETITNIMLRSDPYIYLIDTTSISIKEQNIILKFLEEPLKNAFIILICDNKNTLLSTILNRCQIWSLATYSNELLLRFTDATDDINTLLRIARTPGRIRDFKGEKLSEMLALADNLIFKLAQASFTNTLTILDKLAFKSEQDRFNPILFAEMLVSKLRDINIETSNAIMFQLYDRTRKLRNHQNIAKIDQKYLFENYLIDCWVITHS